MEERRRQGLCYNCDEKWQMWDKCKGAKLFLLEGITMEVESRVRVCLDPLNRLFNLIY